jgi:chaperonin GroES
MASKLRPVGDRVVVKPTPREGVSPSGIVIPETAKEKPQEGTIIAVGPGKRNEMGDHIRPEVHEGDKVLTPKYGGTEVVLEGDELLVMRETDILAVIEGGAGGM